MQVVRSVTVKTTNRQSKSKQKHYLVAHPNSGYRFVSTERFSLDSKKKVSSEYLVHQVQPFPMALSNVLILSQVAGHVFALILSLCIFIPLSIHVHSFSGHCLLFATGTWQESDGLFDVRWASETYCNYPILVGVALFVVSGVQLYRMVLLVYRELESSFLALFFDVVFGITLCAMTIVAAIIITLGFMTWCSDMTERFPSCDIADGQNITNVDLNIQTSGFYIEMGTAQFGAWASFAVWVGLSVFALLKLINNHQLRNMKVSMYIERQRLVNEDVYRGTTSEVPTGGDLEGGRGVGSPGENPLD